MKKILLIFGTRPEAIKMCPLAKVLMQRPEDFEVSICVSGQHREMLDAVLDTFEITPDFDLNIMQKGQTLFDITSEVLLNMRDVIEKVQPDVVLVHGDTTTSFAAALAAFYLQVPVGHVEAGLRTNNLLSPFPEEFNRQAVDIVAQYYFAPTATAKDNLISEGKDPGNIFVTGNTGIDALSTTVKDVYRHDALDWAEGHRLVLLTAHRRENLGDPMRHMFRAIRRTVEEHPDVRVLYPIHMNPQVRTVAEEELLTSTTSCRAHISYSPTAGASKKRRPASESPFSSCATPRSGRRALLREHCASSALMKKSFTRLSLSSFPMKAPMPSCPTPQIPTETDMHPNA